MKTVRGKLSSRPAPSRQPGRARAAAAQTRELTDLRTRVADADATLRAIRSGEVDTVTVAGCPTAMLATSLSLNGADTCSPWSPISETKPDDDDEDELELPVPVPVLDDDELDDDELLLVPPPDAVPPTVPLTAETVPEAGARSVVSASVSFALAREI